MLRATTLFKSLKELGYDNYSRDNWWWPNSGSFEVVVGAILTQNTTWSNVEKSLNNLKSNSCLNLETLSKIDTILLQEFIKPSGFYKIKSNYLKQLSINIENDFLSFNNFKKEVTRDWLLSQKGVGNESADAILNYACYKEAFVVDSYTARLFKAFNYEFSGYLDLQEWILDDYYNGYLKVFNNLSRAQAFARTHGMIVEYLKKNKKGKLVNIEEIINWQEQQ